jgi:hypothetical protein
MPLAKDLEVGKYYKLGKLIEKSEFTMGHGDGFASYYELIFERFGDHSKHYAHAEEIVQDVESGQNHRR